MAERERLPDRRAAELVDFEHGNRRWTVTVGRFPNGRVAEIFIDGPNSDKKTAIVASLALQSGCALETLRHALAGRSAGPLGAALALVDGGAP